MIDPKCHKCGQEMSKHHIFEYCPQKEEHKQTFTEDDFIPQLEVTNCNLKIEEMDLNSSLSDFVSPAVRNANEILKLKYKLNELCRAVNRLRKSQ